MCLLEVIAEDLLELDCAVAVLVHPVGPTDETLVQRRPRALEHPLISGLTNEGVSEAVVGAGANRLDAGLDEVLAAEGVDELLELGGHMVRDELAQSILREDEARHRGGLDHC